jgi:hypothetical protein
MDQRTLFRPVGLAELKLILESDAHAFPPRPLHDLSVEA